MLVPLINTAARVLSLHCVIWYTYMWISAAPCALLPRTTTTTISNHMLSSMCPTSSIYFIKMNKYSFLRAILPTEFQLKRVTWTIVDGKKCVHVFHAPESEWEIVLTVKIYWNTGVFNVYLKKKRTSFQIKTKLPKLNTNKYWWIHMNFQ